MPSDAYVRFMNSLELDYERWHDGNGYDLEALAAIDESERGDVVWELARRDPTWREVEALESIGIPPAYMAIRRALRDSDSIETRLAAAHALHRLDKLDEPIDVVLAREIGNLDAIPGGTTRALLMAEEFPTDAVKRALLDASRRRSESAMHCAGVLCYLTAAGKEAFDWDLRPLFLRLGVDEPDPEREAAFRELCALVKMEPSAA